jgi:hypothetical protein
MDSGLRRNDEQRKNGIPACAGIKNKAEESYAPQECKRARLSEKRIVVKTAVFPDIPETAPHSP